MLAKTFLDEVKSRIGRAEDDLDWFIDAYLWARLHLKQIHKHFPEYSNDWLRTEIKRVFSTDPAVYVRTAQRLGGGSGKKEFALGRAIVKSFGVYECFRAERLLTPPQLQSLGKQAKEDGWDVEQFSQRVRRLDDENRKVETPRRGGSLLRERVRKLERQNESLRAKNVKLREENVKLATRLETIEELMIAK